MRRKYSEKHRLFERRVREFGLGEADLRQTVPSPASVGFLGRTEFRFFLRGGPRLGLSQTGSPVPLSITRCELHPDACHNAFDALLAAVRSDPEVQVFDERTGRGWLCGVVLRAAARPSDERREVLMTLVTTAIATAPSEPLRRLAAAVSERCPDVAGVVWSPSGGEQHVDRAPGWRSAVTQRQQLLCGRGFLLQHICGERLQAAPEAFFRPNLLLATAISQAAIEFSDVGPEDTVWDAFCGQGSLSLLLARRCRRIVALDRSEAALDTLQANFAAQGLASRAVVARVDLGNAAELRAMVGVPDGLVAGGTSPAFKMSEDDECEEEAGDGNAGGDEEGGSSSIGGRIPAEGVPLPDVIVADPGRNGMPKAFRRFICKLDARTIVLIGAGRPLLKDCAVISKRGYELTSLLPFDSHPHTTRLEVVAHLQRP